MIDRRSLLCRLGLLSAGVVGGVGARPAADAVESLRVPDDPILVASLVDADDLPGSTVTLTLEDNSKLTMLRIIDDATDSTEFEDTLLDPPMSYWVGDTKSASIEAYRGDYLDPELVQTVEVNR